MLSATLNSDNLNCFTLMYHDENKQVTDVLAIKWFASIFKTPDGYHIKYPDRGGI